MAESGGRGAVERNRSAAGGARDLAIGVKPLFGDKNVAEGDKVEFDAGVRCPRRQAIVARQLRYELLKIESRYQWYRQNSPGSMSP